jgi:hypothetical protein
VQVRNRRPDSVERKEINNQQLGIVGNKKLTETFDNVAITRTFLTYLEITVSIEKQIRRFQITMEDIGGV